MGDSSTNSGKGWSSLSRGVKKRDGRVGGRDSRRYGGCQSRNIKQGREELMDIPIEIGK